MATINADVWLKIGSALGISRAFQGFSEGPCEAGKRPDSFHLIALDVVKIYFHESVIFFLKILKNLLRFIF
jgi:hypothetical protein